MSKMIIVGSGLVGPVLAAFLAKAGFDVEVFDRMPDPRLARATTGRSVNLTLCKRGLDVLDAIGIGLEVRRVSVPVYGRLIHDLAGMMTFQPYGNHHEAIYSIARRDLHRLLVQFSEGTFHVPFNFNWKCLNVDVAAPSLNLKHLVSGETRHAGAEWICGTDGAHSVVRDQMQKQMRFNLGIQYWNEGYKELPVPSTDRGWAGEKNVIHIWPRSNYMLIAFPNIDQSFTCSLHLPFEGSPSFESITTPEDVTRLFKESFPDAVEFIPGLIESFFANHTNPMITVKCSPWSYKDKVTILGDAAHSIYPSYGQGANAGFEDCAVLYDCIREWPDDRATMLRAFEDRRRPNIDAIAELCVHHFTELQDLVGTPHFLLRKRIERKLNQLYPSEYKDLYSMISFTGVPYTEALEIDCEQRAIVDRLMQEAGIESNLDSPEIAHLMAELMARVSAHQESAAD